MNESAAVPLRLGIVSHQAWLEGAERSLLEMIDGLRARGIWVGVVLALPGPLESTLEQRGVPVQVVRCPWWTTAFGTSESPSGVTQRVALAEVATARVLSDWNVDLVFSNTVVVGSGALAARRLDVPHVWHVHEFARNEEGVQFILPHERIGRALGELSNHVFYNSHAVRSDWAEFVPEVENSILYPRLGDPEPAIVAVEESVDVVVPFHDDPFTIRCLEALARHRTDALGHVWLLDDHSRDEEVIANVRAIVDANASFMTYRRNDEHLGFVGTCNVGMSLSGRDVVLLNTDALVTKGWLDRLRADARGATDVASVTPLSNNASLVSVPIMYENNSDDDPDRTAAWIEKLAPKATTDLPTGNGFCMYMTRAAIDSVGMFDEESFGLGYGEENDWCLRAREAGWRNIAGLRSYVYHRGSQSFGEEKRQRLVNAHMDILRQRYPDYGRRLGEFKQEDPMHDLRSVTRLLADRPEIADRFKMAIVGTLVGWKRQGDAIEATAKLTAEGRDVHLFIVGPDKHQAYRAELEARVADLGVTDRVDFVGSLHSPDGVMRFTDVSIVCSRLEPFGRVTIESMLCGTPVVGAAAGGTAELIRDGETGALFEAGNVDALVAALRPLIEDPAAVRRLGDAARTFGESFTSAESLDQLEATLRSVAGRSAPGGGVEGLVSTPTIGTRLSEWWRRLRLR